MELLGPLKFKPLFKERIWGGDKISKLLNCSEDIPENCGEAWMLSGVENDETEVSEGPLSENSLNELVEIYMGELVGESVYEKFGEQFPILIKLIDANDYLSVQVHPDDNLAQKRGLNGGKTEMWYVMEAAEDAELIVGFEKKISREDFQKSLIEKSFQPLLHREKVQKNDVFYIPAGRIHALGPGILLAEIQQTSDTTYRIYDWDRLDGNGKSRQLHIAEAMDAIDFDIFSEYKTRFSAIKNDTGTILDEKYFTTNIIDFDVVLTKNYEELDSFVIYLMLDGEAIVEENAKEFSMKRGECLLLPAITNLVRLKPLRHSKILEIYIR